MKLLHESDKTKITLQGSLVTKYFIGEESIERFEKEIAFYKMFTSHNLPHFVEGNSKPTPSITTSLLKGETPGFLDQMEAGLLSHKDFVRIREALFNIQNMPQTSLLIHADLAPHNIYLTDSRVVIADWDSYFYIKDIKYRMYDYAFLWAALDFNEESLINIFEKEELPDLKMRGLLNDFAFAYKKRISVIEKYGSKYQTGLTLRKAILKLI